MSSLHHLIAAAAISAAILLSGGACTADQPTAAPSAPALSEADKGICTTVKDASRDLMAFILASPGGDGKAAVVDALWKFSALVRAKKADAASPRLREALQLLAGSADLQAISLNDRASASIQEATVRLNRACGEPEKDDFVAGDWIGTARSRCELPVSFQTGGKWHAVPVGGTWGSRETKGSLAMVCEIGAPAGHDAFIRVWTDFGASGGPRRALDAFLQDEDVLKPVWSDLTLGGAPGAEVVYRTQDVRLKETHTKRAFAVQTPDGVAVVMLGGMDPDDRAVVAAYELAKKTLTVNS